MIMREGSPNVLIFNWNRWGRNVKFRRQPSSASAELVRPGGLVPNLSRSPSRRTVNRAPRRCWSAEFLWPFGLLQFSVPL